MSISHIKTKPNIKKSPLFISMRIDGDSMSSKVDEYFMDDLKWLIDGGFDLISYEHYEKFGQYRRARVEFDIDSLIAAAVPKTIGNEKKKQAQYVYYDANSLILEFVLKEVFSARLYKELKSLDKRDKRAVQLRYRDILQTLMLDRQNLINMYDEAFGDAKYPPSFRSITSVGMHNALRQAIYGNVSYNSYADYEPGAGMAVVRQLIELRIRKAFGIEGYITAQGGKKPIPMSQIFAVLKKHKFASSPNIHSIERIYSFPNIYMHSGRIPFSWFPLFFEYVLRPISFGNQTISSVGYSWDIKNAITITKSELNAIQEEVVALKKDAKELIYSEPECRILNE